MITAYVPNFMLDELQLEYIKSDRPVDKLNFLRIVYPRFMNFEKQWIGLEEERILHDHPFWQTSNKPIAFLTNHMTPVPDPQPIPRIMYPYHLLRTTMTNERLDRIRPVSFTKQRPFLADAMLGYQKYHRWLIIEYLRFKGILDRCLVNVGRRQNDWNHDDWQGFDQNQWPYFDPPGAFRSPALRQLDDPLIETKISEKANSIWVSCDTYPEFGAWTSQVLVNEIYEASYISLIAETYYTDDFFLTEKTGKALLAGRIFIALGSRNILKQIRSLGFKTFDGIFDESYDNLPTMPERVISAMNLLIELSNTNLDLLYEKAAPILHHNQALMVSRAFASEARGFIKGLAV